jgi:hypothetical protein
VLCCATFKPNPARGAITPESYVREQLDEGIGRRFRNASYSGWPPLAPQRQPIASFTFNVVTSLDPTAKLKAINERQPDTKVLWTSIF